MAGTAAAQEWGEGGVTLLTTLNGGRIVPGPGDADGTGTFHATLSPVRNELCYELAVQNLSATVSAQIREGARLRTGETVAALAPPSDGVSKGCVTLPYATVLDIVRRPWGYYVDVATVDYPQGAIRGQIGR